MSKPQKHDFSPELQALLDKFATQKPKDEVTLLKELVERINKNLSNCSAYVLNKDGSEEQILSAEELQKLKLQIPKVLQTKRSFQDVWNEALQSFGRLEFPKELAFEMLD